MKKKDLFVPDKQDEESIDKLLEKGDQFNPDYQAMAVEYMFHAIAYNLEKILPSVFDKESENPITEYPDEDYLRLIENQLGIKDRDKYREEISKKFREDNEGIEGMKTEDAQIHPPEEVVYACRDICEMIVKEYNKIKNEEKTV